MRWPAPLLAIRLLATRATLGRGSLVGALALFERLATPAVAWALFGRSLAWKLALALLLAAAFTLRSFAQRFIAARTEAELFARVTSAVLHGDVLRASVLPDEDARAELFQGVYYASQQLAQELPVLAADAIAASILAVTLSIVEPPRLLVVAMGLALVAGASLAWSRNRMQRETARAWKLQEIVVSRLVDALEGRLEIVAAGRRAAFVSETGERARDWGSASARVAASAVLSGRLPLLAIAAGVALLVGFGAQGADAIPASLADLALFASVTPAFAGVAQGLQAMVRAERWVHVVAEVMHEERARASGVLPPPAMPARIELEGVSFRYDGAEGEALRDVSFVWQDERILALAGANGSGKSTCLRLLLALASPTTGRVRIGAADLGELDAEAWRAHVAFLPQRPYIPPRADVRSAIRLLAPEATDERILDALSRVSLLPALRRVGPAPLDVRVDSLSVGERQRVGLARLLCRDASLFLLDEPDANLDRAGIALVADIVRELAKDRMVVLAAHTPELLALADRIVVLGAGEVVGDERRS